MPIAPCEWRITVPGIEHNMNIFHEGTRLGTIQTCRCEQVETKVTLCPATKRGGTRAALCMQTGKRAHNCIPDITHSDKTLVQNVSERNGRHPSNKIEKMNRGKTKKQQCKCLPLTFLRAKPWRRKFLWWSVHGCSPGDPPQRRHMPVTQPHTASVSAVVQTEAARMSALCNAQPGAGNGAKQPCAPHSRTAHAQDRGDEM